MRVIAGSARGRPLVAPKSEATRPTSDLIRGVIFDILEHLAEDWSNVLDLYAGSGALGIEALSRGADRAVFVERSPAACRVIQQNLDRLGFSDQAQVICQPVRPAIEHLAGPFGLIVIDPPYADPGIESVLSTIEESLLVGPETVIVLEHAKGRTPGTGLRRLDVLKERRHGDTAITLWRRRE